jgi:AcrR family transcriptional regulator
VGPGQRGRAVARSQAQRKAETRGRLLSAAAALFAREGFHGTSTDAVADAADRTSGALYAHFGDKHGLLLALLDQMKDATSSAIRADLEQASSLEERVAVLWRDFAAPAETLGDTWLLLEHELWLWAARHPADADRLAQRYARERARLAQGIAAWHDGTPSRPAPELAVLVLALLLGLEMQHRLDPAAVPDHVAVDGLLALLGAGSAPAAGRRARARRAAASTDPSPPDRLPAPAGGPGRRDDRSTHRRARHAAQ